MFVQRGEMRVGRVSVCGVWEDEGRMCECLWSVKRRRRGVYTENVSALNISIY